MKVIYQYDVLKSADIDDNISFLIPEKYNYIVIDEDGDVSAFTHRPEAGEWRWKSQESLYSETEYEFIAVVDLEGRDWTTCIWEV